MNIKDLTGFNPKQLLEMRHRRDAYQRDYDSSVSGFGKHDSYAYQQDGGGNDEHHELDAPQPQQPDKKPELLYIFKYDVRPGEEQKAQEYGLTQTKNGNWVVKVYNLSKPKSYHYKVQAADSWMRSLKRAPGKRIWMTKDPHWDQLKQHYALADRKRMSESATAGATSAANIGTVVSPQLSPGKARGKKSYTGSVATGSGTKAPPQPKVVQPKKADGTAVNALDMKGKKGNLFGSQAESMSVIKRG